MNAHQQAMQAYREQIGMAEINRQGAVVQIAIEPYDGTEGMHRCADCGRQGSGCARYVPALRNTPQHCGRFKTKRAA